MTIEPNAIDVTLWQAIKEAVAEIMSANSEQEKSAARSFDWPALSLFFLLATAFWIPPMPHSMWSLPMMLRICWLTVLLSASYIVLFRRNRETA